MINILFESLFLRAEFFQKARVNSPREEILDVNSFAISTNVHHYDIGMLGIFPDDLPASAARWCQHLCVDRDREVGEVPFTFRKRLPDGDALGAHGQAIARTLNIAAAVYLAGVSAHGSAHQEI